MVMTMSFLEICLEREEVRWGRGRGREREEMLAGKAGIVVVEVERGKMGRSLFEWCGIIGMNDCGGSKGYGGFGWWNGRLWW